LNLSLPATIEECHKLILLQQKQIEFCLSKIIELEARLNQNSSNSNRPPSSDFGNRGGTGIPKVPQKQGGQKGHKGKTLLKIETPDKIIQLGTEKCTCGAELDASQGEVYQTYQVFDIPEPKLFVTEYQRLRQVCVCGQIHKGVLPDGVNASVQYGSGVRAFTTLMSTSCQLSYEKISTLFTDLFGYDLNESTAVTNNRLAYERLEHAENQIKAGVLKSGVVHFDESGLKVGVKNYWLHTACTKLLTHLFVSVHRGTKAHQEGISILGQFKNWAVHDCYATYFTFTNCQHALCIPHLLRELKAQMEENKKWAGEMHTYLLDLYKQSQKGTKTVLNIEVEKKKWQELCRNAIQLEELLLPESIPIADNLKNKKRGRKKKGKALSLLHRLLEHCDAVMAFAQYEAVPFSNNQAERDVRPVKTKQKVAGCFRTVTGADYYARIQGFISSCRKNKINVFNELRLLFGTYDLYNAPFGC
jgi:transposase